MPEQPSIGPKPGPPAINDCWNKVGVQGDASCAELEQHVHCRNCPTYSAAAIQLLDRELPADYRNESTRHFAKEAQLVEPDTHSVVIFRVEAEWLALPAGVFLGVMERKAIHSLPHRRNRVVLGLVNVRGELLVCVSLEEALGLEKASASSKDAQQHVRERLLVVNGERGRLVFPVAEVHGIHRYHLREVREVPSTIAKAKATCTQGMLSWRDKAVGILNDQALFSSLDRSLA